MLPYGDVALFILVNLLVYLAVHVPLDIKTYTGKKQVREEKERPPAWKNPLPTATAFITSGYVWLLFFTIPLTALVNNQLFYELAVLPGNPATVFLQVAGLTVIAIGTVIACWGRINRGKGAMSWGIPERLVKIGAFKKIRHPLYSSYVLYFIGFSLIFQSLLVLPLLLGIYGYNEIAKYEEEILVKHFGEEYGEYMERTGRFFPRLK